ncbi:MAG TPA: hypothetical protein VLO11_06775 [Luteolibacter sp.]|nr:hypothetical protein [Luteolibacter sp.]
MKPTVEQVETLLALKRHELPGEEYWQDFLCEFHHRQRERVSAKSGISALIGGVSAWFTDFRASRLVYGAGLAYAAATIAFILIPRGAEVIDTQPSPVNYQVLPAAEPVEQLEELDLSPETQGSIGEQVF